MSPYPPPQEPDSPIPAPMPDPPGPDLLPDAPPAPGEPRPPM